VLRRRRALTVVRSSIVGILSLMRWSFLLILMRGRLKSLVHWHLSLKSSHSLSSHTLSSHTHHLPSHGHPSHSHSLHVHVWHTHHRSAHSHTWHHTTAHRRVVCLHTLVPLRHQRRRHSSVHLVHHATTLLAIEVTLISKITSSAAAVVPASIKVTALRLLTFSTLGLSAFNFNLKSVDSIGNIPSCL